MKRIPAFLLVLAVLLASAQQAAAAWPPPTKLQVSVIMSFGIISGTTDPGQLVDVTLKGPGGEVKATDRALADASGSFSSDLSLSIFGRPIEAGDTLEIMLGGEPGQVYSAGCSSVTITGVNLATGIVSGLVTPRQKSILFQIAGPRVVPVPDPTEVAEPISVQWRTPYTGEKTRPDGTFDLWPIMTDGSWVFYVRRNDTYQIGYQVLPVPADPVNFSFVMLDMGYIPGLGTAYIGSNLAQVYGSLWGSYRGTLRSPAGTVKGTGSSMSLLMGFLQFMKRNGDPALIASGDTIRISGQLGFSAVVPRLRGRIRTVANEVIILGPPRRLIQVQISLFDDLGASLPSPPSLWVKTDAAGRSVISLEGSTYTLREGDRVSMMHLDPSGNVWVAEDQALPPAE